MSETTGAIKARLRTQARGRVATMSGEERASASRAACARLLELERVRSARVVLAYAPMAGEPDLSDLVAQLIARGVRVALPRVDWERISMEAWLVRAMAVGVHGGLEERRPGLMEARTDIGRVGAGRIDTALVPGLAFDESGGRLGRGRSFYDRFLPRCGRAARVGVCFDGQIVAGVPMEDHDAPMHTVVTDRRTIAVAG